MKKYRGLSVEMDYYYKFFLLKWIISGNICLLKGIISGKNFMLKWIIIHLKWIIIRKFVCLNGLFFLIYLLLIQC